MSVQTTKQRSDNQRRNRYELGDPTVGAVARGGSGRGEPDWNDIDPHLIKTLLRTVDAAGGFTGYGRSSDGGCLRVTAIIGQRSASIYEHRTDRLAERIGDLIEYILRYGRVW